MDLSKLYAPLTAMPLRRDRFHTEAPPGGALKPYVRCFWGSLGEYAAQEERPSLVVPDTCMDLIFHTDALTGRISALFCAMYDRPFWSAPASAGLRNVFAIRFHAWAAVLFCEDSIADTLNHSYDAARHFPRLVRTISAMLHETPDFSSRCVRAEALLLALLAPERQNPAFMNAIYAIVKSRGRMRAAMAADGLHLTLRQLERLFLANAGVSPKAFSTMVRYQNLWRDAVFDPGFDVQDAVWRYGYTDQAHLLRQFKAYHSLTLRQAVRFARDHVAFLQDPGASF